MTTARALVAAVGVLAVTASAAVRGAPFHIFSEKSSLLSFVRPQDPTRYVGYRIVEGDPVTTPAPLPGYDAMPKRRDKTPPSVLASQAFADSAVPRTAMTKEWKSAHENAEHFFRYGGDGTAHYRHTGPDGTQFSVFQAVEDGIEAWMWLEPKEDRLGGYLVQQCLRYSGNGATEKRSRTAHTPDLSEYDLWERGDIRSLSYVRQGRGWKRIPAPAAAAAQARAQKDGNFVSRLFAYKPGIRTMFFTPPGIALSETRAAQKDRHVPVGLIVRESADGKTVSGMYWERTAEVSLHHPADCLHATVDLGPTARRTPLVVRGKIYDMKGTKDDLLAHWKRDFTGAR